MSHTVLSDPDLSQHSLQGLDTSKASTAHDIDMTVTCIGLSYKGMSLQVGRECHNHNEYNLDSVL